MKTLTEEEIARLTPKQQETLASIGLHSYQVRQRLLAQAHSYLGRQYITWPISLFILFLFIWNNFPGLPDDAKPHSLTSIAIIAVTIFAIWHAVGINRRLDALLKLLDSDFKKIGDNPPPP
jgi:hypothetical protein